MASNVAQPFVAGQSSGKSGHTPFHVVVGPAVVVTWCAAAAVLLPSCGVVGFVNKGVVGFVNFGVVGLVNLGAVGLVNGGVVSLGAVGLVKGGVVSLGAVGTVIDCWVD